MTELNNGSQAIATNELAKIIGVPVSVTLIESLGFTPALRTSNGCYWAISAVPAICFALSTKLAAKGSELIQEYGYDS